jgi:hypothetical protein
MARCCDGKNAYQPITKTRYKLGLLIFYLMHIQCRLLMFLRHVFIKKYPDYRMLLQFYHAYFSDTLRQIKEQKGMVIKNQRLCQK